MLGHEKRGQETVSPMEMDCTNLQMEGLIGIKLVLKTQNELPV